MPPAHIDAANGYRYYRSDQVQRGRLIRTLREMGLPLADIATVADASHAEPVLRALALEQDQRHAREKAAFYSALKSFRQSTHADTPRIAERMRDEQSVATRKFTATRHEFAERFLVEQTELRRALSSAVVVAGDARCALLDPLADETGELEVVLPVAVGATSDPGIPIRKLKAERCAVLTMEHRQAHASELIAALDAMFDWFDRRALRAVDVPLIAFERGNHLLEIEWPYAS